MNIYMNMNCEHLGTRCARRAADACLKASYTSSLRPHTLVAQGLIH